MRLLTLMPADADTGMGTIPIVGAVFVNTRLLHRIAAGAAGPHMGAVSVRYIRADALSLVVTRPHHNGAVQRRFTQLTCDGAAVLVKEGIALLQNIPQGITVQGNRQFAAGVGAPGKPDCRGSGGRRFIPEGCAAQNLGIPGNIYRSARHLYADASDIPYDTTLNIQRAAGNMNRAVLSAACLNRAAALNRQCSRFVIQFKNAASTADRMPAQRQSERTVRAERGIHRHIPQQRHRRTGMG